MERKQKTAFASSSIAEDVRNQIESGREGIWKLKDSENMPFAAIANILSLSKMGIVLRISKGLNVSSRQIPFRESKRTLSQSNFLNILQ